MITEVSIQYANALFELASEEEKQEFLNNLEVVTQAIIQDEEEGWTLPVITDDAMVLEYATDHEVKMVEADYRNIKITTPEDLAIAKVFLSE